MPPRTPLRPLNANARVKKKPKTSRKELSPHKRALMQGMYMAGSPIPEIAKAFETSLQITRDTVTKALIRYKGQSAQRSGRPRKFNHVEERAIIRYY